jgi:hypothetical protein
LPYNCLRGAYAGDGLRTGEFPWLSSASALSTPPNREARTTSSGMMNCLALVCASSHRPNAAISFSIAPRAARAATRSASTASGHQSSPERKPRSSWVAWRRATIRPRSDNSTTRRSPSRSYANCISRTCAQASSSARVGVQKKATTIVTDTGRIHRHIVPLIGSRRVKDLVKADINRVLKDIMAGKCVETKKLRGKANVRGGVGTATRTVGLLGGILTYAVEAGIIESNPAQGIRKPKDNVRNRRLTEAEYRTLGEMLRAAAKDEKYATTVDIIRQVALTGCRRSEIIGLTWSEVDTDGSCLRLVDSKEGASHANGRAKYARATICLRPPPGRQTRWKESDAIRAHIA